MPRVSKVRSVLLSAPYGEERDNLEVILHLPSGLRTTGLVEITLDNDAQGLGEGYIAVFAPRVFAEIVELIAPIAIGRDIGDLEQVKGIVRALETATGYWSFQGAARHVVSAFETALLDAWAQTLGQPLWRSLGGAASSRLRLYASGGDSVGPVSMQREIDTVAALGIDTFKIRARKHQAAKAVWCQRAASRSGIVIAIDMAQNLAIPSQTPDDVASFLQEYAASGLNPPAFLEEVLGPLEIDALPALRRRLGVPLAGGEIVTTPLELNAKVWAGCYDIVQPDATVIGGVLPTVGVFAQARASRCEVYVHCWGSGVGMLANYHAALAGGGTTVEWPLPPYALRQELFAAPLMVEDGCIVVPNTPGIGGRLTPYVERAFPFREEAVYRCLVDPSTAPAERWT